MNDGYLIPANSKRSMLIFSIFAPIDLIIFGVGILITVVLAFILNAAGALNGMGAIAKCSIPAIICGFMVVPVPNHRNVWQLTVHIYNYLINPKQYKWRGWCMNYGGYEETNDEQSK